MKETKGESITLIEEKPSKKYNVPALDKALSIIEILAEQRNPLGVSDICKLVDIPKTSAFFILNTLEGHDYINKTEDGKYKLGTKFLTISSSILNKMDIREFAKPFMQSLMERTGFTVHMATLDHGEALFIDKLESQSFVKFSTYIGQRQLLHLSGVGKAIAAYSPLAVIEEIIKEKGLPQKTENTITSWSEFKTAMESIRKQGYAIEDEEGEIGVRCIAAPIYNDQNILVAAISITALRTELSIQDISVVGNHVKETAIQISKCLGYTKDEFPIN
ncbi:IclR family transcriptional regulator [Paenibacillus monticola]|uniref:Helix-turn-helix domain-containing protein n=1 Tax=Paenibacillus monticola TaxID=2666075 RepID=A0A7X2H3A9_9BACL|nr:IclR family transcriptional regulator [Paenibacillus monticola]MRN52648.1 helix-turn-helix domain-containing protein [Paenibacillus monticola]